jgi:hypothetical protein
VPHFIDRDAGEPGTKAGLRPESREEPPRFQNNFLSQIVSGSVTLQHESDASFDRAKMALHQRSETIGLAIQSQPDQIVITEEGKRSCICRAGCHLERKELMAG